MTINKRGDNMIKIKLPSHDGTLTLNDHTHDDMLTEIMHVSTTERVSINEAISTVLGLTDDDHRIVDSDSGDTLALIRKGMNESYLLTTSATTATPDILERTDFNGVVASLLSLVEEEGLHGDTK